MPQCSIRGEVAALALMGKVGSSNSRASFALAIADPDLPWFPAARAPPAAEVEFHRPGGRSGQRLRSCSLSSSTSGLAPSPAGPRVVGRAARSAQAKLAAPRFPGGEGAAHDQAVRGAARGPAAQPGRRGRSARARRHGEQRARAE
eukprot:9399430-Pyramimonas_sp.AAC.1